MFSFLLMYVIGWLFLSKSFWSRKAPKPRSDAFVCRINTCDKFRSLRIGYAVTAFVRFWNDISCAALHCIFFFFEKNYRVRSVSGSDNVSRVWNEFSVQINQIPKRSQLLLCRFESCAVRSLSGYECTISSPTMYPRH